MYGSMASLRLAELRVAVNSTALLAAFAMAGLGTVPDAFGSVSHAEPVDTSDQLYSCRAP